MHQKAQHQNTFLKTKYATNNKALLCERAKSLQSVVFNSLRPRGLQPARLLCPWGSPGKRTGVGCHALLQGVFPTQGLNPGQSALQAILD